MLPDRPSVRRGHAGPGGGISHGRPAPARRGVKRTPPPVLVLRGVHRDTRDRPRGDGGVRGEHRGAQAVSCGSSCRVCLGRAHPRTVWRGGRGGTGGATAEVLQCKRAVRPGPVRVCENTMQGKFNLGTDDLLLRKVHGLEGLRDSDPLPPFSVAGVVRAVLVQHTRSFFRRSCSDRGGRLAPLVLWDSCPRHRRCSGRLGGQELWETRNLQRIQEDPGGHLCRHTRDSGLCADLGSHGRWPANRQHPNLCRPLRWDVSPGSLHASPGQLVHSPLLLYHGPFE
mmetsp:Transcript_8967/g.25566  ORF Transcript_8967/g.25566 Transcript_8967/m.25566 type:complete len:283 (-) Transcript_8967:66-914(-)